MIPLTLGEVAAATGGRPQGDPNLRLTSVTTDSRDVVGTAPLFVALGGEHGDGHDHAAAAVAAGAVAVLSERDLAGLRVPVITVPSTWRAIADLARHVRQVVGPSAVAVTGSVGKTTVKDLTAAAVGAERHVHASRGSFNNELGVPLTLLGLDRPTEVLVAEVGSRHVGDIAALAPLIAPDVAVVTAVAAVHLEVFGSIEGIQRAKAELVESLGPDGTAVLNVDDPRVAAMARLAPHVIGVGLNDAPVTAHTVELDERGRPRAIAVTPWGETPLSVPVAGRHQLLNALLALAVAGHLGVDLGAAAHAIATAEVSRWRGEVVEVGGVTVLDDAYNANPTAVAASLQTLASMACTGRRWAVLGVMAEIGPTAADEHEAVGRRWADEGIDELVVVGDAATPMVAGARAAGVDAARIHHLDDVATATELLASRLRPGDVVLVKGSRVAGLDAVVDGLRAARGELEDATT